MISLTYFRTNLHALFTMFTEQPGMYIDIIHKGRLYRVTVEDLGQEVKQKRRPRRRSLVGEVQQTRCRACRAITFNGVCMNSGCATNLARPGVSKTAPAPSK